MTNVKSLDRHGVDQGSELGKRVELRGLEPLTPSMRTRCATRLRYSPWNRATRLTGRPAPGANQIPAAPSVGERPRRSASNRPRAQVARGVALDVLRRAGLRGGPRRVRRPPGGRPRPGSAARRSCSRRTAACSAATQRARRRRAPDAGGWRRSRAGAGRPGRPASTVNATEKPIQKPGPTRSDPGQFDQVEQDQGQEHPPPAVQGRRAGAAAGPAGVPDRAPGDGRSPRSPGGQRRPPSGQRPTRDERITRSAG